MTASRARGQHRRTQEERRAATQAALLDAAIDCLVEYGYAGTTTIRVVERAGVSRGAQVHYYPTKSDLVAEAVQHLATRRAAELSDLITSRPRRLEVVVDALWQSHSGPLYQAAVELYVAARTDPELRERLRALEDLVNRQIAATARVAFGGATRSQAFVTDFGIVLATMRGLALLSMTMDEPETMKRHWRSARRRLIEILAPYADADAGST